MENDKNFNVNEKGTEQMKQKEAYTGIDYFRIIAALLIVAIHTSPLSSYNETADFILTRIIARVGVPFFFMTSGFFLISEYNYDTYKLKSYLKKTMLLYSVAIIIYIPINIYTGYFSMEYLVPNIIKDIVFDGTLYHLWYLPASMLGVTIAWLLVKKVGLKWAALSTLLLYLVGMFGDSYYGISNQIPLLRDLYKVIFELSDYTRNGIFFAPVFFILGGIIASKKVCLSFGKSLIGCVLALAFMICEGVILNNFDLQRHDSMYIMLVPCMFFMFNSLVYWKGKRVVSLRTVSLIIYVIHPMIIVLIRMCSKVLGLQEVLISNSIMHYITVSAVSLFISVVIVQLQKYKRVNKRQSHQIDMDRSWIEVDLQNLEHNVTVLQNAMPEGCKLMAVVKAQAYGQGAAIVSNHLNKMGIETFVVATIDEGIELRRTGIRGEILVMGYTSPARAKELHKYDLIQTLIDFPYAVSLNSQGCHIKAHIKVDTGMHRLGFSIGQIAKIERVFNSKYLDVCGMYTHLSVADSLELEDIHFTHCQISKFYNLIDILSEKGIKIPKIHIQSSYGLLNYPELNCDYVRAGIILYGVLSSKEDKIKLQLDLRPVLSLKSQVILIREIAKGESVGYGRTFIAMRDSRIAILPIGYADGLPRNMSCGNGEVLLHGERAPIIGRICMDHVMIDITDILDVKVGDSVTLIGKDQQAEICVTELAQNVDTITNELLSRMGRRLKIVSH